MGRKLSKPKDPTYSAIEAMVAQSGLNATTQEEVVNYSKLFMKAFLERAMQGEMNHFLKEEVRQASLDPEAAGNSRNGYGRPSPLRAAKFASSIRETDAVVFCLASFRSIFGGLRALTIRS